MAARYVVTTVRGMPVTPHVPARGGGDGSYRPMPFEASVLDSACCYQQVAVFCSGPGVNADKALRRAADRCAQLNKRERLEERQAAPTVAVRA